MIIFYCYFVIKWFLLFEVFKEYYFNIWLGYLFNLENLINCSMYINIYDF